MLAHVQQFVDLESPSNEPDDLQRSAEFLADVMTQVLGKAPEIIPGTKGPHVHWKGGDNAKGLVVCHPDTVFPKGTFSKGCFSFAGSYRFYRFTWQGKCAGRKV